MLKVGGAQAESCDNGIVFCETVAMRGLRVTLVVLGVVMQAMSRAACKGGGFGTCKTLNVD